jgi:hypothetical protein
LVVFYDGFNDAMAAYHSGTAGNPVGEDHRAREFNLLNHALASRRQALYRAAAETMLTESSLGVALRTILRRYANAFYRKRAESFQIANSAAHRTDARLADEVARDYLKNMWLADATAVSLGIPINFYWQPSLGLKNPLSALESQLVRESAKAVPGEEQFAADVYGAMHAIVVVPGYRGPRITDLTTILNGQPSCFVDDAHIVEACNAVIASRIAADAIPILRDLAARDRLAPRLLQSPRP